MFDEELSPAERQAFDALPHEQSPSPSLEERTVALLRQKGHLPTPLQTHRRADAQTHRRSWLIAGAAAAAVAIFASGMALGQYLGMSKAVLVASMSAQSATEAAVHVQRTGDLYVAALASLGNLRDTSDVVGRERARQTALAILGAAAEQIAHLAPDDPLAAAVLRGLNQRSRNEGPVAPSRSVIWY
jgi:hypothetical protein